MRRSNRVAASVTDDVYDSVVETAERKRLAMAEVVRQDHRILGMAVDGSEDTNDAVLLTVLPDGHVEPVTRIADNETLLGVAYTEERRQDLLDQG